MTEFIAVPMGWLMRLIYDLVQGIDSNLLSAYAISIILATIIVRLLTLPLTLKSTKSMKKMQELNPQLKELQEKYGKDPQTLQRKQMELYKESGYNPFGGCLPLLIQMPLLIGFFAVISNPIFAFEDMGQYYNIVEAGQMIGVDVVESVDEDGDNVYIPLTDAEGERNKVDNLENLIVYAKANNINVEPLDGLTEIVSSSNDSGSNIWKWTTDINRSFFWIKDLSVRSNHIFSTGEYAGQVNGMSMGFVFPFIGAALPILAAISGFTTYLTSKMMSKGQPAAVNEQAQATQTTMTIMMPIMIFVFALSFASGLALYWVVGNIFQFVQQYLILRSKKPKEV